MKDYTLEVTRYFIDTDGAIKITHVKVCDSEGKYVKFAKLKEVLPYLSKMPVTFKEVV